MVQDLIDSALADWLAAQLAHVPAFELEALPAEASFRSFYRVLDSGRRAGTGHVVMVSPPDREHNEQFERLAALFAEHSVPVPTIIASHPDRGWYLLTDVGVTDLKAAYQGPEHDPALEAAITTLVRIQQVSDPIIPPYTPERFTAELGIFEDWFVSRALSASVPVRIAGVFAALVARTQAQRQCCVHRDYHCRNLLFHHGRLGVVDFQDALIGPVSYDLASLLHDCYHEFSDAEIRRWIDFYLEHTLFELDRETLLADVEFSAVQRQLKAVGIFARLKLRDGKSSHLAHIAPVLRRVQKLAARHRELAPLAGWLGSLDDRAAMARLQEPADT